jgi:hypothetical protein
LLLRRLGEVETPGKDGLAVDDHDLVVSDGVLSIDPYRNACMGQERRRRIMSGQGIRLLYSNACDFKSKDASIVRDLSTLSQIFPGLDRIGVVADGPLVTVNGIAVDEELMRLGRIDFGGGLNGKAALAIWRNRLTRDDIVGEFSYQIKCGKSFDGKSRDLAERFFTALHRAAADCSLGWTTKTAILYGLESRFVSQPRAHGDVCPSSDSPATCC